MLSNIQKYIPVKKIIILYNHRNEKWVIQIVI